MIMTAPPATGSAIAVRGIAKSYGEVEVLRGVDFDVARGSVFALLGSNGAGKTTLIKILSTLLDADAGAATVGGHDVTQQPQRVRESISLTGQFAAVDEVLTGRESLVLVAKLRHLKQPGEIADALLSRFELAEAGGRKVATYSGGMRPSPGHRHEPDRRSLGDLPRRAHHRPGSRARLEVWRCIRELAEHGTTVLLTTQHLDEAEQLADRIAILHQGTIIQNGTLAELKRLLPPTQVTYVEQQPTLEEVFLTLTKES